MDTLDDVCDAIEELVETLRGKDGKPASRETSLAVTKLQEALFWLIEANTIETLKARA